MPTTSVTYRCISAELNVSVRAQVGRDREAVCGGSNSAGGAKRHDDVDGCVGSFAVIEPAERYLAFGRRNGFAPNTVKAYARRLAQWWTYLEQSSKRWDAVRIYDFGNFLAAVRHHEFDPTVAAMS